MSSTPEIDALILSGDDRIQNRLAAGDAIVVPAYACQLDGFVNDTFTQYANASIYRPASVCIARLISTLQDTARQAGNYHLGFTMYTTAGHNEAIEVWIGHRRVALARVPDPDNRLHLFLVPERFPFKGGETFRLVTGKTDGPCRIENIVFLKKRPRTTAPRLDIISPHVDIRQEDRRIQAYITWITNRPSAGHLRWGASQKSAKVLHIVAPLVNHEAVLDNLVPRKTYQYEIRVSDRTGHLHAVHTASFKADPSPRAGSTHTGRIPLLLRRSCPRSEPWPISAGIPFRKGALGSSDQIRLVEKNRKEIPLQARTLARWPDSSVQWALLDFTAESHKNYTVEYGHDIARTSARNPLHIIQSRTAITVTTGPIQVEFPKDRAVFPGILSLRLTNGTYRQLTPPKPSPAVTLIADDGTPYQSGIPDAVVLEESGPERVCVRIELTHQHRGRALFRSIYRVHLFRNSDAVRVLYTFENDRIHEEFTSIQELNLRINLDVGTVPQGTIENHKTGPLNDQKVRLRQSHDDRYIIARGRRVLTNGNRASGIGDLFGGHAAVTLVARDFWQNYPKGLTLDGEGITVQICPPIKKSDYAIGGELEDRLYYYLLEGRYKFKCGVSRTHELWFQVRSGGSVTANFISSIQNPPLYSVSLSAINRSHAVGQIPSKEKSPHPPYEDWTESARKAYGESRNILRTFGMLNYGDWFGEQVYNWGNLEYDTPWCFLQEYLRGGHPVFYTWAEEAAHHLVDVDTCHYHTEAKTVGMQYAHCVGHVGGYYPDGYRENAINTGSGAISHTWVEGLFLYYFLSGDARILETAMATCNLLVRDKVNDYDFLNPRECGWHLIHLSAAYRSTGRRAYLNAARIIVDRAVERQRESGCWEHLGIPFGVCHCLPPRHTGSAAFTASLLMTGLHRYNEITGEKRASNAIVRGVDYLIDHLWVPQERAFRYTSCPHSVVEADMRVLNAVAAAYRISGDARTREVLLAGLKVAFPDHPHPGRNVGKAICYPMRSSYQVFLDMPEETGQKDQ